MAPRYIAPETLQAREEELLDSALDIISSHGVVAFTMDKLVASVSYSKGTVYNHFSAKEDVLAGLCNRNMILILDLFSRAAAIEGSARDKMTAIGFGYMLSVLMAPQSFALAINAKTEMFDKASETRQEQHRVLDEKLFGIIQKVIDQALQNDELVLAEGVDAQKVSFALWAMSFGTIGLLLDGAKACSSLTGMTLEDRVIAHGNMVKDGLGWAKGQRDSKDLINHLKSDIFSEEVQLLRQQGVCLA